MSRRSAEHWHDDYARAIYIYVYAREDRSILYQGKHITANKYSSNRTRNVRLQKRLSGNSGGERIDDGIIVYRVGLYRGCWGGDGKMDDRNKRTKDRVRGKGVNNVYMGHTRGGVVTVSAL